MKKLLILTVLSVLTTVSARAETIDANKLSVVGLVNASASEIDEVNLGAGALINLQINRLWSIETGGLYVDKLIELPNDRLVDYDVIHIPVLFRYQFGNGFSGAFGPFMEVDPDDLIDEQEFGLDLALTKDFIFNNRTNMFVEGRYSSRITDNDGADFDQVMLLAGVRLNI